MTLNTQKLLDEVLGHPESELVEFKLANWDYETSKICDYVSGLANEANINDRSAWFLILWVEPKNHQAVWTWYKPKTEHLNALKQQIYSLTKHSVNIHEANYKGKRIIIIEIPPAPRWIPISSNWHCFGRENESLTALSTIKHDQIRNQITTDWSSEIIFDAKIEDLDTRAITLARENYKKKHPKIPSNIVDTWSDEEFLNRARITINSKITRTALILLGKNESSHFLSPYIARVTWVLKGEDGLEKDYEHFDQPFLLIVDEIYSKIRNLRYRYIQNGTLFPEEVDMYDPWVLRELLNNCIAHQDYSQQSKIVLVEYEDGRLIFENVGLFIPGSVEKLLTTKTPPKIYRNPHLANAMVSLNMIDSIGSGIKRVFERQRRRFFPMPTYTFPDGKVAVELFGKILDLKYANLLAKNSELSLLEIMVLDKIQKGKINEIERWGIDVLKKKWLIEGRYPNIYLSEAISVKIWKTAEYVKNKWINDSFCKEQMLEMIRIGKWKGVSKEELSELVYNSLPQWMQEKQKKHRITNLIQELRKDGKIKPLVAWRYARWIIN